MKAARVKMIGLEIVLAVVTVAALIIGIDAVLCVKKRRWGENE